MKRRVLGRTGEQLSIIGFGGILVMDESAKESERLVNKAIEKGINYFDVAPNYGNAQQMLGPALKPYRDDVFLACKSELRDYDGVMSDFTESLKLLKTDHIDLYQLHAVTTDEDVNRILSKDGALNAFQELRDKGVIRYIGFSAHTEEAALRLLDHFDFDTILFPFNWVTWHKNDFGKKLMKLAQERNLGILALKALAKRALAKGEEKAYPKAWYYPVDTFDEAQKALKFTLSLPITAAVTPGHEKFFNWACEIAEDDQLLTEQELEWLKKDAKALKPIFPED